MATKGTSRIAKRAEKKVIDKDQEKYEGGSNEEDLSSESLVPKGSKKNDRTERGFSVQNETRQGPADKSKVGQLLIACGEIFGNELSAKQPAVVDKTINRPSNASSLTQTDDESDKNGDDILSKYKCEICRQLFWRRKDLRQHMFTHNGHLKFKCDVEDCGWSFKTKYKLERHQVIHGSEKRFKCPMENCDRSFWESHKLNSHVETHWRIIQCPVEGCHLIFTTNRDLSCHVRRVHTPKSFSCYVGNCDRKFDSQTKLESHVSSHSRFACSFPGCEQSFNRKSYLEVHTRSHTKERPFKCTFQGCDATFTSVSKLNRHRGTHEFSRPFVCEYDGCEVTFKRKDNLNQHIKMRHMENNKLKCPFEGCNSTFSAKCSLKEHICVHTKENSYQCPVDGCGKVYYSKTLLSTHLRRHQAKAEREEKFLADEANAGVADNGQFFTELLLKPNESTQLTDISVNEVLIPAKSDTIGSICNNGDAPELNSENTVIALGEAVCFQYMNTSDRLSASKDKTDVNKIGPDISSGKSKVATRNSSEDRGALKLSVAITSSSKNSEVENSSPVFASGSVTVPLSMTRFLPREIQVNELFCNEYSADHSYNRSLLPVDPPTVTTSENRSIDNAIESALTGSEFDGPLVVNNSRDSMIEMRSFLVESGIGSFLANDDVGRMETCISQDELNIARNFERSRDINSSLMLEDCIMDKQSSSLSTNLNHYSTNDSYVVSLMGPSQIVNEHLLNISQNPTMVDHMYSQHSPEGDDLQIITEDQVYEESTVNIQDIR